MRILSWDGRHATDLIENYSQTIRLLGEAGVPVICYNFMPVFDWTRSQLAYRLPDGSTTLTFEDETIRRMDPVQGDLSLPGWDESYTKDEMQKLIDAYKDVTEEVLWSNLAYFLERIIPVAEEAGVRMAIHPDDPPWSIFGLPRIVGNMKQLRRLTEHVDSPANGITFCSGSLGLTRTMISLPSSTILVPVKSCILPIRATF